MRLLTIPLAPGATTDGGGVCSFMSWARLEQALKNTGEVRPGEVIEKITVESNGLTIYYKRAEVVSTGVHPYPE